MERAARELGDEAAALHEIMPHAVVVGLVLVRSEACEDAHPTRTGPQNISSFAHGVFTFRKRAGRSSTTAAPGRCELVFLGYYEEQGEQRGDVRFVDVTAAPRRKGPPPREKTLSLSEVADQIFEAWKQRWEPDRVFDE